LIEKRGEKINLIDLLIDSEKRKITGFQDGREFSFASKEFSFALMKFQVRHGHSSGFPTTCFFCNNGGLILKIADHFLFVQLFRRKSFQRGLPIIEFNRSFESGVPRGAGGDGPGISAARRGILVLN